MGMHEGRTFAGSTPIDRFLHRMHRQAAAVYLVHAVFPGDIWRPASTVAGNVHTTQISVGDPARQTLWQKERLLNLAAAAVPAEFDALAWIDADTELPDDWQRRTLEHDPSGGRGRRCAERGT